MSGWALAFLLGAATSILVFETFGLGRTRPPVTASAKPADSPAAENADARPRPAPSLGKKSDIEFQRFCELAAGNEGGSFDRSRLMELAQALDPVRFPSYAREVGALPVDIVGRSGAIDIFFAVWTQHDPAAASRFVLSMPRLHARQKDSALSGLVEGWPADDAEGLIDLARRFRRDADARSDSRQALWKAAAADPEAAMAAADEFEMNLSERSILVMKWAAKDAGAAREWVSRQPAGQARERLASDQAMLFAHRDPEAALAWIDLIDSPRGQETAITTLLGEWAVTDRAAASRFVEAQRDPSIRDAARAGYLAGWASEDPAAVAKFLDENPGIPHAAALAQVTLQSWTEQDPAAAAGWVCSISDEDSRMAAARMLIPQWCRENEAESFAWLKRQIPPGPKRDQLIIDAAGDVGMDDPARALRLAALLPPSKDRETIEERSARDWMDKNPVPAAAWIQSSNLPDDVKARLLAPPRR